MHHRKLLFVFLLLRLSCAFSQVESEDAHAIKSFNFSSFQSREKNVTSELERLTPPDLKMNPDYGYLPSDAPCSDCIELLDHRSSNTRFYVKNGSNGSKFFSQASSYDINYKNAAGEILAIEPTLSPVSGSPGLYKANQQPDPTTLNLIEGFTSIQLMDGNIFRFNDRLTIYSTNDISDISGTQFINRSNYTVGKDGAHVINAFNGVDQQLIFSNAQIKSNYLMYDLSSVNPSSQFFVVEDEFILPDGFKLTYDIYEGLKNQYGFWRGELVLENPYGIEMGRIAPPIIYDNNLSDTTQLNQTPDNLISYIVEQVGNKCKLKMIIETKYLIDPSRVFPITIDPTVFGATATWTGPAGTDETPNWCTNVVSVPTPANATLTGSSIYWEFVATGVACAPVCKLKYLQARIGTSCGYSPSAGGVWVCPGCNIAGTWNPTVDDATTAALVSCKTPQCSSYNIDFTLYHNQFQCTTPGACVTTCAYLQKFQVTIEGETVAVTALAEGAAAYTVVNCADQSGWISAGTPNYGVPGYTYSWTPTGYTGVSEYVTFPLGVTVYTVTITDACGNTATDAVTVTNNCLVLPINLLSFTGYHQNGSNYLDWEAETGMNQNPFIIERSPNGLNFEQIGEIEIDKQGQNNNRYLFIDNAPFAGLSYYRLKRTENGESTSLSDIIAIKASDSYTSQLIINNQNPVGDNVNLTVFSPTEGAYDLNLYDVAGKLLSTRPVTLIKGATTITFQLPEVARGVYLFAISINGDVAEAKFIK